MIALACLPLWLCAQDSARAEVYLDVAGLRNGGGIPQDDYLGTVRSGFKAIALFRKGNKRSMYSLKKIWGFRWRGGLFRCDVYDMPVCLLEEGEICYWQAERTYISHGIDGELIVLPEPGRGKNVKALAQLRSDVRYVALCDCLDAAEDRAFVRRCVEGHNRGGLIGMN